MDKIPIRVFSDIEVIKTEIVNLSKSFEDFRQETRKLNDDIDKRMGEVEVKNSAMDTKINNFAIFQSFLSVIVGAIATFLGAKR